MSARLTFTRLVNLAKLRDFPVMQKANELFSRDTGGFATFCSEHSEETDAETLLLKAKPFLDAINQIEEDEDQEFVDDDPSLAFELYNSRVEESNGVFRVLNKAATIHRDHLPLCKLSWQDREIERIRNLLLTLAEGQSSSPTDIARLIVPQRVDCSNTANVGDNAGSDMPTPSAPSHSGHLSEVQEAASSCPAREESRVDALQKKGVTAPVPEDEYIRRRAIYDNCVHYQVIGMLGMLLIYELCGRLPPHQRPDVLYVYRADEFAPLSAQEDVHIELMYYTSRPCVLRLCCPLRRIPADFWRVRYSARPLYAIADSCLPTLLKDVIRESSMRWFESMRLFVYLASPVRSAEAMLVRREWPFYNTDIVPSMSLEDYLRYGYRCSNLWTRQFLCETAGIAPEMAHRVDVTPPAVVPLMEYIYLVMGGSPLCLFHFAVVGAQVRQVSRFLEITKPAIRRCLDGKKAPSEMHARLQEMCALRIGFFLLLMSPDDVGLLFFRHKRVGPDERGRFTTIFEYASPALKCVLHSMVALKFPHLNAAVEWYIGAKAVKAILEDAKKAAMEDEEEEDSSDDDSSAVSEEEAGGGAGDA